MFYVIAGQKENSIKVKQTTRDRNTQSKAAVFLRGRATGDLADSARFELGQREARTFRSMSKDGLRRPFIASTLAKSPSMKI